MSKVLDILHRCYEFIRKQPQANSPKFPSTVKLAEDLYGILTSGVFDPVADIEAFHVKFGLEYKGPPRVLTGELATFREKFLQEEIDEYKRESLDAQLELSAPTIREDHIALHLEKQLDALIDEIYVALGTAYLQGFDVREAWRRVHMANMAKVRAESADQSKRGSKFDVIKPEGWKQPNHLDLVTNHAHRKDVK